MPGFVVQLRGMKERLGRDVAPVRRIAAKSVGLNNGNALALAGSNGSSRTSASAAADDDKVVIKCYFFCHCFVFSLHNQPVMFV